MGTLRDGLLGGWRLESFVSRDLETNAERHPYGDRPDGLILYTADGYMSAQLTPGEQTSRDGSEYIAYAGRFQVDEQAATVHHQVQVSSLPELLTSPQYRAASIDGDRLTLSADLAGRGGKLRRGILVWRRAG